MLLQQLKSGFKKVTNWNKYQSKATMKASNQHLKVLGNNFFELKNFLYLSQNCFCKWRHLRCVWHGFWIHSLFVYVLAKLNKSLMMCLTGFWIRICSRKLAIEKSVLALSHHTEQYYFLKRTIKKIIILVWKKHEVLDR